MRQRLTLLIAVALTVASCGEDSSGSNAHASDVYPVVIKALAPDRPGDPTDELDRVVFVGPINEDVDISLGVQAAVVEDLDEFATIRFVDDKSEAIGSGETEPVIDDGILVLLGAVPAGDSPSVRAVRYVDVDDVARFRVTVEGSRERWTVADIDRRGP